MERRWSGGFGLEDLGSGGEIEGLDLEVGRGRGGGEGEGVCCWVEVELGAEDGVGILEEVEGSLEKREVRGFGEENG